MNILPCTHVYIAHRRQPSTRPTFAVTQRTHPLRCRPSKLDSHLDGVKDDQDPAGFVASSRHPGPVRASARGVFSRNWLKVG